MKARSRALFWPATLIIIIAALIFMLRLRQSEPPPPAQAAETRAETSSPARNVVLWISVDGLRPDYIDRATTPFFDRIMGESLYSRELLPVFPSLTFPSHVSQATGVAAGEHGATGNSFYDEATGEFHRFPWDSTLLEAEPIWLTAQRQGIRTAVIDWPLSHAQAGPVRADYFGDRYDPRLSDAQRLNRLLTTWREDESDVPLQLLMGYMVGPDSIGHQVGPGDPQVDEKVEEVDQLLARFIDQTLQIWHRKMQPQDNLYVLFTTDHGMSEVSYMVNIEVLPGVSFPEEVRFVTGGNVAHIHFDMVPLPERQDLKQAFIHGLKRHDFLQVYLREELPESWGYAHPTRVGELVVVLDNGYTFNRARREAVYDVAVVGSPRGMHGYDVGRNPEMKGLMVLWRHPEPFGGEMLGPVHSLQLHPTVAQILGISPAPGAAAEPLDLHAQPAAFTRQAEAGFQSPKL